MAAARFTIARSARVRFIQGMAPPADLDRLSDAELKSLVIKQFETIAQLQRTIATLGDEIAQRKGGPSRPNIKSSGMEKAIEPPKPVRQHSPKRGPHKS